MVVKRVVKRVVTKVDPDAPADDKEFVELANMVISLVKDGSLDFQFDRVKGAMDDRLMEEHNRQVAAAVAERKKQLEDSVATKQIVTKLPPAPTRAKKKPPVATVVPVVGKVYQVVSTFPKIGDAIVKFVKLRDDNKEKAVVQMVDGVSGFPAGKQTVIPLAAIKEAPAVKRTGRAATVVAPATRKVTPVPKPTLKPRRRAAR